MADTQNRGFRTRIIFDWETAFKTVRTGGAINGIVFPFLSSTLSENQSLVKQELIRGTRSPSEGYRGRSKPGGNLVMPLDTVMIGYLLRAALGQVSTVESPVTDIKTGSPTVTFSDGGGGSIIATFSVSQTAVDVGDRVIYTDSATGLRRYGYLLSEDTPGTAYTIADENYDTAPSMTLVAAHTVVAIVNNEATTPGTTTVTIAAGVATFSVDQGAAAAANKVFNYGVAGSSTFRAKIVSGTHAAGYTVVDEYGTPAADITAATVYSLEARTVYTHTFTVSGSARVPSFTLDKANLDLTNYEHFIGCKVNTLDLTVGGAEGPLSITAAIVAAGWSQDGTPYDSTPRTAILPQGATLRHEDIYEFTEGGDAENSLETFSFKFDNKLETEHYGLLGGGQRTAMTEGMVDVSGAVSGILADATILTKAMAGTESSISITLRKSATESLTLSLEELKYEPKTPEIPGPAGLMLNLNYSGHYVDGASASVVKATLVNYTPSYSA